MKRPPRTPPLPRSEKPSPPPSRVHPRPPAPIRHAAPPQTRRPGRAVPPAPPHTARPSTVARILDEGDRTLLDVVDSLLNRGVLVNGEVVLGLAGIDLIYLRLSVLLCAADRLMKPRR